MYIKIESVKNPIWIDKEKTAINCIIKTNHVKVEIPFTASPYDSEEHGKKLFSELISGKYGKIEECTKTQEDNSLKIINKENLDNKTFELIEFIAIANKDLSSYSPRNIVILWSAKFEYVLKKYLEVKNTDFVRRNPSFNKIIKLMKSNSFFDEKDFECAENIRLIRNIAAHEWNFTLYTKNNKNKSVQDYIKNLYYLEHSELFKENFEDLEYMTKMFFTQSCARLIMKFI